jgi:hypothetical protein
MIEPGNFDTELTQRSDPTEGVFMRPKDKQLA